ncbi:unnamed protein product [Protopolystoma xenopodis]|uniref:Uncharacterized protein n=1 Tax=Protopolystoma xenopodis TaxID=117903 RepID=A0A448WRI1_9PLAT|nr:unnamed protein product [Protopolystoma xenopodis]
MPLSYSPFASFHSLLLFSQSLFATIWWSYSPSCLKACRLRLSQMDAFACNHVATGWPVLHGSCVGGMEQQGRSRVCFSPSGADQRGAKVTRMDQATGKLRDERCQFCKGCRHPKQRKVEMMLMLLLLMSFFELTIVFVATSKSVV